MSQLLSRLTGLALVVCACAIVSGQGQQPSTGAGLVVGRVVDAASSRPIAGAIVTIGSLPAPMPPAAEPTRRVVTDGDGRFLFRDLRKGTYTFIATAPGYLDGGFGQRADESSGQPFALDDGQRVGDVTVRLWKEARVSGTVRDESGGAVAKIAVTILRRDMTGGRMRLSSPPGYVGTARTDDRGAFEFAGLPPGDYVVGVPSRMTQLPMSIAIGDAATSESLRTSGSGALDEGLVAFTGSVALGEYLIQTSAEGNWGGSNALAGVLPFVARADGTVIGYPATFHPSTSSANDATTVALKSGDARANVDIELRPTPLVRVSGLLSGPSGPQPNFVIHLLPAYAVGQMLERTQETAVTVTDSSGRFTFVAVPPGQYVLRAWHRTGGIGPQAATDPTLWAETPIAVANAPVTGADLDLRSGLTISGRIVFDGTATPPQITRLRSMLLRAFDTAWPLATDGQNSATVTAANEFTTQGLPPGRYLVQLPNNFSTNPGWYFESAILNKQDLSFVPIELTGDSVSGVVITFADRKSDLSGTAKDASGKPAALVVAFPADVEAWIRGGFSSLASRTERVSQSGTYSMATIRPGDYLVVALDDENAKWQEAAIVRRLAAVATKVTIARGETKTQDLVTRSAR